ncbi:hypothetical protein OFR22_12030 [Brachyspira hyodysenteriae]|uniref:hypothetical protein n=1 Tax=Brachyspira hyodysenteriae TaxID=159 RepID=UPI0022CD8B3B|nr:hypothetical protein [Brachyspira hyodysenteriae]MCZ9840324.1 hypothetical protein [Brachyspira hyodysenteriae]MCZ9848712.1 hypothetical protein [Brachyspira hyodysenteriae]MCZ9850547.1 hypothetical protein [Brachyspira hyodysenteriae]MCZ9860701.1 hypothetical protein [Brachyspira hyodysenteriae]MCZ9869798.1 hypothetical protein [Brachyspira hyodysenteriae]
MKKILSIVISLILTMPLYSIDVQSLFNLPNNGEIVYYKSENINNAEYSQAEKLKSDLQSKGYKVYSIVIADVLPKEGNEFIALISSAQGDKISIYNKDNEEFSYKTDRIGKNAAVDLENFYDIKNEIGIIKYYVINDNGQDRDIYMYMFRIDGASIKFIADVVFYKEINSMKSSVITQMDNIFEDIDGDGIYEMLVESRETIDGRNNRVEYQIYKLSKSKGKYECIMSSWLEETPVDLSGYFRKRIEK